MINVLPEACTWVAALVEGCTAKVAGIEPGGYRRDVAALTVLGPSTAIKPATRPYRPVLWCTQDRLRRNLGSAVARTLA
jgi:hypothetical protein